MAIMTCNGVSINYRCIGKGRDIVMIHGLAANHAFWNLNVLLPFARRYRVTVYDLRGHGYSDMPPRGYTVADMAEDLHCLLDYLDIARVHLIGHSFGGAVALHYTVQYPERVMSLTIADSRVRTLQPTNCLRDLPNWVSVKESLEKLGFSVPEDETEIGLWFLEQLALPKWRQNRQRLGRSPLSVPFSPWGGGNRSAEKWLELLQTTTARQEFTTSAGPTSIRLSSIQTPIFMIYGEKSLLMPSFLALRDLVPYCRTTIIPGAGHFHPLTRPKLFVTLVTQFLQEIESQETGPINQPYKSERSQSRCGSVEDPLVGDDEMNGIRGKANGRLEGQVAIVTGGTVGIGRATCMALAQEGARIVIVGRNRDRIDRAVAGLEQEDRCPRALGLALDVTQQVDMEKMARRTLQQFGRIDILIAAAGTLRARGSLLKTLDQMSVEEWDEVVDTNLKGIFLSNRAVLPTMIRQGSGNIVNLSSTSGRNGLAYDSAYCASKFGIIGLSEALAEEMCQYGIRVQVLLPGAIETGMWNQNGPLPRPGAILTPERVADLIMYMVILHQDTVLYTPVVEPFNTRSRTGWLGSNFKK